MRTHVGGAGCAALPPVAHAKICAGVHCAMSRGDSLSSRQRATANSPHAAPQSQCPPRADARRTSSLNLPPVHGFRELSATDGVARGVPCEWVAVGCRRAGMVDADMEAAQPAPGGCQVGWSSRGTFRVTIVNAARFVGRVAGLERRVNAALLRRSRAMWRQIEHALLKQKA